MSLDVIVSESPKAIQGKIVKYTREDGLAIFLDGDKELDYIRTHCDKKTVIMAVAVRRAQQIARNYAMKYAEDLADSFKIESLSTLGYLPYVITNEIE